MTKTVMLIHGAWLTPAAWGLFRRRYEAKGYTVVAPPWPGEDLPLETLRRAPPAALRKLTIGKIVDHYAARIAALPEPPILVGHSFGGLFVQLLLDRGLGAAGVALDPANIAGVPPSLRQLVSALPVFLAWWGWDRVLTMSFDSFVATFANGLPEGERRLAYDQYVAPTPGRLYYQGALGVGAAIQAGNPRRPPLLLIAGEADRTVTPDRVRATFEKQKRAPSATELKTFAGRSHFLFAEPGWEEVADYALDWAARHAAAS